MSLADIVGKENVVTAQGNQFEVRPGDTAELQAVVRWANEEKEPLVPVSSGPPHCHDGSKPDVEEAVVLDLRRMGRILRVDAANRVAIVEPGVTYAELQQALAPSGLSAYMPLLPRATKSVLASVLDRDPIVMPAAHFDSTDPMLCTEIVLGTGDRMRTGEAAGPDALEEQWEIGKAQISPFGPTQMDPQRLVSGAQGTIGIVTWMSLKCRFLSELSRAFFIPGNSLDPLVELNYNLTRIRFTGSIFVLNGVNLACLMGRTPEEISDLRDRLPAWVMFVSCEGYGPMPEEKVQYLEADLKELAKSYGLELHEDIAGVNAVEFARLIAMPSSEPYWKLRLKGGFDDIFFLTTLEKTPEFAGILAGLAERQGFSTGNIGAYIQPVVQGTSCHCEFNLYFDPSDETEKELAGKLAAEAVDRLEEKGAFFSRPYSGWIDAAYRRAGDTADMQKKVKDIFDPNWILNPGKLCFK